MDQSYVNHIVITDDEWKSIEKVSIFKPRTLVNLDIVGYRSGQIKLRKKGFTYVKRRHEINLSEETCTLEAKRIYIPKDPNIQKLIEG